jgi:hypothetical protein
MLLVDTRTMTPIVWCDDYATCIEYVAGEPPETRSDFAVYQYKTRIEYKPSLPIDTIPTLLTVVDHIETQLDGTNLYHLRPVTPICDCDRDAPGCPTCVGEEND